MTEITVRSEQRCHGALEAAARAAGQRQADGAGAR